MDERLVKVARMGDVMALNRIMEEDPDILERACSVHFADSALHVAARRGKAEFVKQIVTRLPSLATETNQQGMIPLHLASLKGHVETVRELLKAKLDDEVNQCLLKDDEGWTPLHCASQKGKISVIEELIRACPQCLEQVTEKRETVLHVAVKANQFEAVKVLADSIKRHNFDNLLKAQDQKGKSACQLAAAKKLQSQVVEVLKEYDEIREERHINIEGEGNEDSEASNKEDQKMRSNNEGPWSQQDAILVVATLIITLTYQALENPPTTLFKDGSSTIDHWGCLSRLKGSHSLTKGLKECPALLPFAFLFFNTLIFIQSIFIVISALRGRRKFLSLFVQFVTVYLILCYFMLLAAVNYDIVKFSLPIAGTGVLAFALVLIKDLISIKKKKIKDLGSFAKRIFGILAKKEWRTSKLKRIDQTRCPATSAT